MRQVVEGAPRLGVRGPLVDHPVHQPHHAERQVEGEARGRLAAVDQLLGVRVEQPRQVEGDGRAGARHHPGAGGVPLGRAGAEELVEPGVLRDPADIGRGAEFDGLPDGSLRVERRVQLGQQVVGDARADPLVQVLAAAEDPVDHGTGHPGLGADRRHADRGTLPADDGEGRREDLVAALGPVAGPARVPAVGASVTAYVSVLRHGVDRTRPDQEAARGRFPGVAHDVLPPVPWTQ